MKKRKKSVLHPLHIITTKKIIIEQVEWFALEIDKLLINCIVLKKLEKENSFEYLQSLYSVCWRLHMTARFVYKGKAEIGKLHPDKYRKILFEGFVETYDEIERYIDKSLVEDHQREDMTRYVFQVLRCLEKVLVEPIAMTNELVYVHEFAAVIDYVIQKDGKISMIDNQDYIFALVSQHEEMEGERWNELFDRYL